jgi:hypothetical protein
MESSVTIKQIAGGEARLPRSPGFDTLEEQNFLNTGSLE